MIWFTSDTHYYHRNIIEYCNRPFANIEEMNEVLIERWNERVKPQDEVYHLGDFAFCKRRQTQDILDRLNGKIHLIVGNHDKHRNITADMVTSYQHNAQLMFGEYKVLMTHHPDLKNNNSYPKTIRLHGHSHGKTPMLWNRIDVGVDCWDMHPITFDHILEKSESLR